MRLALVVAASLLVANVAAFAWWRAGPGPAAASTPSPAAQFEPDRIKVLAVEPGQLPTPAPVPAGGERPPCAEVDGEGPREPCAPAQSRQR